VGLAQASVRGATSWSGCIASFETLGFAVEKTGRGGRVLDVETVRHVPFGRVATSMCGVATRAVVGASLAIDGDAFTLERVVTEVRAILEAAAMLAERQRVVELRAPDVGHDEQQQAAYAHLPPQ